MLSNLELIVGTYEDYLVGYKIVEKPSKNEKFSLIQTFASKDHVGSIRCVASSKQYIASGGSDDKIILYDMNKRNISQMLTDHQGTINTLAFSPDTSHLISGGSDGQIILTRTSTWNKEKIWKNAHKGSAITHIGIHPSGKLALSIGRDLTLKTWDLLKGRSVFIINLKVQSKLGIFIELIEWSTSGKYFALIGIKNVEIWNLETASIYKTKEFEVKINCLRWKNDEELFVGLDNGSIFYVELKSNKTIQTEIGKTRVKEISLVNDYLGVILSSGDISVYQIQDNNKLKQICTNNIGCRPTCLTIIDNSKLKYVKNESDEATTSIKTDDLIATPKLNSSRKVTVEIENDDDEEIQTKLTRSAKKRQSTINIQNSTPDGISSAKKKKKKNSKIEKRELEVGIVPLNISDVVTPNKIKKIKKDKSLIMDTNEISPKKKNKKLNQTLPSEDFNFSGKSLKKKKKRYSN